MKYNERVSQVFADRLDRKDRLFSFWTHLPEVDHDAEKLAQATIAFQKEFDLDFIKTMPNGMYAIEDYGVDIDFSGISEGGVAEVVSTPFQTVSDWVKLSPADLSNGAFERELRSLRLIREGAPGVPILFTVFSPMTIASKLSQGRIREQIANPQNHAILHDALAIIADDTARLSEMAIELGADGVFFAHQDTDRRKFCFDDFSEFVHAYDMEALAGARNGSFNVLHLHGDSIRFFELANYPVDALNWHIWEVHPQSRAVLNATDKCIVGGINRWSITENDLDAIRRQISHILDAGKEHGNVIVTPGCTIRHGFDPNTLHFIREQIRNWPGQQVPRQKPTSISRQASPLGHHS